ncbi:MAG: hypothetical protein QNJ92_06290 [Alphaproteobacteria bacterium]|nr:hypothetical protein [Alphaproteobacteria bacterium]
MSLPAFYFNRLLLAGLALVIGLAAPGTGQAAKLLVLTASPETHKPGAIIDAARPLHLDSGERLTVVDAGGSVLALSGPYDGPPIKAADHSGDGSEDLLLQLQRLIDLRRRPPDDAAAAAEQVPHAHDPWLISTAGSSHHCLAPERPAAFWRADVGTDLPVELTSAKARPLQLSWARGEARLYWPAGLVLSDGTEYRLRLGKSQRSVRIVLHLIPADLPSEAHRIAWMAEQGCTTQARMLLDRIAS